MDKLPSLNVKEFLGYFLPGLIILIALTTCYEDSIFKIKSDWVFLIKNIGISDPEALVVVMIFSLSLTFGVIIVSVQSFIETFLLDYFITSLIFINLGNCFHELLCKIKGIETYFKDWTDYVNGLSEEKKEGSRNRYISRVSEFYQFESRLALGLFFSYFYSIDSKYILWIAIGLYFMSLVHHCELANYRKQNKM